MEMVTEVLVMVVAEMPMVAAVGVERYRYL